MDDPRRSTADSCYSIRQGEGSAGRFTFDTTPIGDLICAICMEPWQHAAELEPCGHIFCKQCIQQLPASNGVACPSCRATVTGKRQPNRVLRNMVDAIRVTCDACEWNGTMEGYRHHPCNDKDFTKHQETALRKNRNSHATAATTTEEATHLLAGASGDDANRRQSSVSYSTTDSDATAVVGGASRLSQMLFGQNVNHSSGDNTDQSLLPAMDSDGQDAAGGGAVMSCSARLRAMPATDKARLLALTIAMSIVLALSIALGVCAGSNCKVGWEFGSSVDGALASGSSIYYPLPDAIFAHSLGINAAMYVIAWLALSLAVIGLIMFPGSKRLKVWHLTLLTALVQLLCIASVAFMLSAPPADSFQKSLQKEWDRNIYTGWRDYENFMLNNKCPGWADSCVMRDFAERVSFSQNRYKAAILTRYGGVRLENVRGRNVAMCPRSISNDFLNTFFSPDALKPAKMTTPFGATTRTDEIRSCHDVTLQHWKASFDSFYLPIHAISMIISTVTMLFACAWSIKKHGKREIYGVVSGLATIGLLVIFINICAVENHTKKWPRFVPLENVVAQVQAMQISSPTSTFTATLSALALPTSIADIDRDKSPSAAVLYDWEGCGLGHYGTSLKTKAIPNCKPGQNATLRVYTLASGYDLVVTIPFSTYKFNSGLISLKRLLGTGDNRGVLDSCGYTGGGDPFVTFKRARSTSFPVSVKINQIVYGAPPLTNWNRGQSATDPHCYALGHRVVDIKKYQSSGDAYLKLFLVPANLDDVYEFADITAPNALSAKPNMWERSSSSSTQATAAEKTPEAVQATATTPSPTSSEGMRHFFFNVRTYVDGVGGGIGNTDGTVYNKYWDTYSGAYGETRVATESLHKLAIRILKQSSTSPLTVSFNISGITRTTISTDGQMSLQAPIQEEDASRNIATGYRTARCGLDRWCGTPAETVGEFPIVVSPIMYRSINMTAFIRSGLSLNAAVTSNEIGSSSVTFTTVKGKTTSATEDGTWYHEVIQQPTWTNMQENVQPQCNTMFNMSFPVMLRFETEQMPSVGLLSTPSLALYGKPQKPSKIRIIKRLDFSASLNVLELEPTPTSESWRRTSPAPYRGIRSIVNTTPFEKRLLSMTDYSEDCMQQFSCGYKTSLGTFDDFKCTEDSLFGALGSTECSTACRTRYVCDFNSKMCIEATPGVTQFRGVGNDFYTTKSRCETDCRRPRYVHTERYSGYEGATYCPVEKIAGSKRTNTVSGECIPITWRANGAGALNTACGSYRFVLGLNACADYRGGPRNSALHTFYDTNCTNFATIDSLVQPGSCTKFPAAVSEHCQKFQDSTSSRLSTAAPAASGLKSSETMQDHYSIKMWCSTSRT